VPEAENAPVTQSRAERRRASDSECGRPELSSNRFDFYDGSSSKIGGSIMGNPGQDDSTRSNQQQQGGGGKSTSPRTPDEMSKGNQDAGSVGSTSSQKDNRDRKDTPGSRPA
jgi:hypothetical protein